MHSMNRTGHRIWSEPRTATPLVEGWEPPMSMERWWRPAKDRLLRDIHIRTTLPPPFLVPSGWRVPRLDLLAHVELFEPKDLIQEILPQPLIEATMIEVEATLRHVDHAPHINQIHLVVEPRGALPDPPGVPGRLSPCVGLAAVSPTLGGLPLRLVLDDRDRSPVDRLLAWLLPGVPAVLLSGQRGKGLIFNVCPPRGASPRGAWSRRMWSRGM